MKEFTTKLGFKGRAARSFPRRRSVFAWIPLFLLFVCCLASRFTLLNFRKEATPICRFSRDDAMIRAESICRNAFALPAKAVKATPLTVKTKRSAGAPVTTWDVECQGTAGAYSLHIDAMTGDLISLTTLESVPEEGEPRSTDRAKGEITAQIAESAARRYLTALQQVVHPNAPSSLFLQYARFAGIPYDKWEVSYISRPKGAPALHYRLWLSNRTGALQNLTSVACR